MLLPFQFFFFILSLASLTYASYSDLKTRTVSDMLNYFLVISGILSYGALSLFFGDLSFIISCFLSTATAFAFGWLLWKLGVWAGGDVKLLTGLSAINPVNYAAIAKILGLSYFSFSIQAYPIFPITLFVFSVFSMLPYAIIITALKLIKENRLRKSLFLGIGENATRLIILSFFVTGLDHIFLTLSVPPIICTSISLLLFAAIAFTKTSNRSFFPAFAFVLFIYALLSDIAYFAYFVQLLISFFIFYILLKLAMLSIEASKREVSVNSLEEGMISAELIVERNNRLYREEMPSIGTILNHLKSNSLEKMAGLFRHEGKVLANPRSAAGLSEQSIRRIKELAKESGIERIRITESVPFVPAVLIAYLLMQLLGDVFWKLIF